MAIELRKLTCGGATGPTALVQTASVNWLGGNRLAVLHLGSLGGGLDPVVSGGGVSAWAHITFGQQPTISLRHRIICAMLGADPEPGSVTVEFDTPQDVVLWSLEVYGNIGDEPNPEAVLGWSKGVGSSAYPDPVPWAEVFLVANDGIVPGSSIVGSFSFVPGSIDTLEPKAGYTLITATPPGDPVAFGLAVVYRNATPVDAYPWVTWNAAHPGLFAAGATEILAGPKGALDPPGAIDPSCGEPGPEPEPPEILPLQPWAVAPFEPLTLRRPFPGRLRVGHYRSGQIS